MPLLPEAVLGKESEEEEGLGASQLKALSPQIWLDIPRQWPKPGKDNGKTWPGLA